MGLRSTPPERLRQNLVLVAVHLIFGSFANYKIQTFIKVLYLKQFVTNFQRSHAATYMQEMTLSAGMALEESKNTLRLFWKSPRTAENILRTL